MESNGSNNRIEIKINKKRGRSMFWGVLLTVVGVSLILETIFHIEIPVVRIALAFFIIYLGIKMLVGPSKWHSFEISRGDGTTVFGQATHTATKEEQQKEYSTVFGRASIDLKNISLAGETRKIDINTVFGEALVEMPADIPFRLETNTVFGETRLPGGNASFMGQMNYESPNFKPDLPYLKVQANTVFGALRVMTR